MERFFGLGADRIRFIQEARRRWLVWKRVALRPNHVSRRVQMRRGEGLLRARFESSGRLIGVCQIGASPFDGGGRKVRAIGKHQFDPNKIFCFIKNFFFLSQTR